VTTLVVNMGLSAATECAEVAKEALNVLYTQFALKVFKMLEYASKTRFQYGKKLFQGKRGAIGYSLGLL